MTCKQADPVARLEPYGVDGYFTTETDELHVVIGASGATGRVVVRELVAKGKKRVRAVNRGGRADVLDGVEGLAGDATDPNRPREVCRSAVVVYHYAMPPFRRWVELFHPPGWSSRFSPHQLGEVSSA